MEADDATMAAHDSQASLSEHFPDLQCRLPITLVATEPAQAELLIAEQSSTHSLIAKQRTILPELQHTVLLNTVLKLQQETEEMKKSRGLPNASECPLADTTSAHSK